MMKCEFFQNAFDEKPLTVRINEFLSGIKREDIIDIKITSMPVGKSLSFIGVFIFYETNEVEGGENNAAV